jgi:hypothetical protein
MCLERRMTYAASRPRRVMYVRTHVRGTILLARTLGVVGGLSWISLMLLFVAGEPFGAINDIGNGVMGLLSGALAVRLRPQTAVRNPIRNAIAMSSVALGAAICALGSVLILWDVTSFFFAGLVSGLGFAFIGIWLVAVNHWIAADVQQRFPRRLFVLGVMAGVVMMIGFINLPGVIIGLDDMGAAPVWILAGGSNWLGTYLLLPIWSIWFSFVASRF